MRSLRYNIIVAKIRLDLLLVERGLAESRAKAQALIMAGEVRVDGQVTLKPATPIDLASRLEVELGPRFVSRGGEKLDAALEAFGLDVRGRICADVGASTGGFTDCLLQRGATKIYAVDVGKGILDWRLRNDARVVVMEETNARFVESLPERVSFITLDASFISLKILLPVVRKWLLPLSSVVEQEEKEEASGDVVALVKPQFEAGKKDVSRGDGVIRNPEIHKQVLRDVLGFAQARRFGVRGLIKSPLLGPKGNTEFLVWLDLSGKSEELHDLIDERVRG